MVHPSLFLLNVYVSKVFGLLGWNRPQEEKILAKNILFGPSKLDGPSIPLFSHHVCVSNFFLYLSHANPLPSEHRRPDIEPRLPGPTAQASSPRAPPPQAPSSRAPPPPSSATIAHTAALTGPPPIPSLSSTPTSLVSS